eukprot:gene11012-18976_t
MLRLSTARLLALVLPLASAQESNYHTAGDVLHWYSHNAGKVDIMSFEELQLPEIQSYLPLAAITGEGDSSGRHAAILVFGEHAREIITTEVSLWMSKVLLGDGLELLDWHHTKELFILLGVQPDDIHSTVEAWTKQILSSLVLKILPIENLDGRVAWEAGDLCLRRTGGSHVDLNRNWAYAWKEEGALSEVYGGPKPFSEPQSQKVKEIAEAQPPRAFINVHSGEWAVYTAWDSKPALAPNLPGDLVDLIDIMGTLCKCTAGPAGAVSGYLAFGTGMDYMYKELKVPYALTVEVGGANYGLLRPGQTNKRLDEYRIELDSAGKRLRTSRRLLDEGQRRRDLKEDENEIDRLVQNAKVRQHCFSEYNPTTTAEYQKAVSTWVITLLYALQHIGNSSHPLPPITG